MPNIITKVEFDRICREIKDYSSTRGQHIQEPEQITAIEYNALMNFFREQDPEEDSDYAFSDEQYKLISAALYKDIRDLEYFTRHALLSKYDKKEYFDSGSSSKKFWMGGKKNLDEEEKCVILASLFDRLLKKVNFKYKTDCKYDLWGIVDNFAYDAANPMGISIAPIIQVSSDIKDGVRARNTSEHGSNDNDSKPCYYAECSPLAYSLAALFFAFGVPFERLRAIRYGDHLMNEKKPNMVVTRSSRQLMRSNNIYGIYDGDSVKSASIHDVNYKLGAARELYDPAFEMIDVIATKKWPIRNNLLTNTKRPDDPLCIEFASKLKNTLIFDINSRLHPCNIDVFTNHWMIEVKPGKSEIGNIANFYDPLYKIRYKNGPKDLLEIFSRVKCHRPSFAPHTGASIPEWNEYCVEEWHSSENNKRRLYSIPYLVFKHIDSILESGSLSKMKFNNLLFKDAIDQNKDEFSKTSVSSYFNPKFEHGYTLSEYLFHRHNLIYIYIDERHWVSQSINAEINGSHDKAKAREAEQTTGHPYQIVWLLELFLSKSPFMQNIYNTNSAYYTGPNIGSLS